MNRAIKFEDYVKHFADQVLKADSDFTLMQTYYHNKFNSYNLASNGLQIGEIDVKLFLRKYKPCFFLRLFSRKDWNNFYKISNADNGDFQVIISMRRKSGFDKLETNIDCTEDLSAKFII